jgi:glycosyltransferase involved in cell wall biosynthesis
MSYGLTFADKRDTMKRVTVIQEHLPHYRAAFFGRLKERLERDDILLDLVHAVGQSNQFVRADLAWATRVRLSRHGAFVWHHDTVRRALQSDLIICVHELKYLTPAVLQLVTRFRRPLFAYWGHGRNFQATNSYSGAELVKQFQARHVDWWFAYNELSANVLGNFGFPKERIITVDNAIDTRSLQEFRADLAPADLDAVRSRLRIKGGQVAVYTGGLYSIKRIRFLLDAAVKIREAVPDFELIVIGDGPERCLLEDAARMYPWVHAVGTKDDREKVPYWAISKLLLMPGGVGLVVLDSFALGVPMVTTDTRLHGPEIGYLKPGENGVLVRCGEDVAAYAEKVVDLLMDDGKREILALGALASSGEFTLEKMVENFVEGIVRIFDKQAACEGR